MKAFGVIAGLLIASAGAARAQDAITPASIMALNQSGRWVEAADRAASLLASADGLTALERCEVRFHLGYAHARTGNQDDARSEVERVLSECTPFADSWVLREARQLVDELSPDRVPEPTIRPDDGWVTATPGELGLNAAALEAHRDLCEESGAAACLIAYRGRIVQEWYGPAYREPMNTMSTVKSWTALLAGMLIEEGRLGLDDPVERWIPEWIAGVEAGVTVRHLLSMTSGLPTMNQPGTGVGTVADKNAFVFSLPLAYPPGERWQYSNEGAQLLSPILTRAAGVPIEEYARERLFLPLGMRDTELRLDEAGSAWTYADAKTTLRDFAKICQVVLDGGRSLSGEQVVPATWIDEVARAIPQNPGYGLLWFRSGDGEIIQTSGYLNTDCLVIRPLGLVIARMQSRPVPGAQPYYGPRLNEILRQIDSR